MWDFLCSLTKFMIFAQFFDKTGNFCTIFWQNWLLLHNFSTKLAIFAQNWWFLHHFPTKLTIFAPSFEKIGDFCINPWQNRWFLHDHLKDICVFSWLFDKIPIFFGGGRIFYEIHLWNHMVNGHQEGFTLRSFFSRSLFFMLYLWNF